MGVKKVELKNIPSIYLMKDGSVMNFNNVHGIVLNTKVLLVALIMLLGSVAHAQDGGFGPEGFEGFGGGGVAGPGAGGAYVTVMGEADRVKVEQGGAFLVNVKVKIREGLHINPQDAVIDRKNEKLEFAIASELKLAESSKGFELVGIQWPKGEKHAGDPGAYFRGEIEVVAKVKVGDDTELGEGEVVLVFTSQACEESGTCYPPEDGEVSVKVEVVVKGMGDKGAAVITSSVDGGGSGTKDMLTISLPWGGSFSLAPNEPSGFVAMLLLSMVGGFALNFMPCVLPVIPIKILGLQKSAKTRGKSIFLGSMMSLGVMSFWGALGVILVIVQAGASQIFTYWWFNMGMGLFIAVMAVGMGGLFAIRLPNFVYRVNPKHDSVAGAFGFGVMTSVLALPCTAPLAGGTMGWAATQTQLVSFTVFLSIGVGMAIPYVILAAYPKLIDRLPRTGPASDVLKQVFSLMMLAAAVFFIGSGIAQYYVEPGLSPVEAPVYAVMWMILSGTGLWLAIRSIKISKLPKMPLFFAMIGFTIFFLFLNLSLRNIIPESNGNEGSKHQVGKSDNHIEWVQPYSDELLEKSLKEGKVVVLEFTANWCANCKVLEGTVLHTPEVAAAMRDENVVPIKVDLSSDKFKVGWDRLKSLGFGGPPLLAIYKPGDDLKKPMMKSNWYTITEVVNNITEAKKRTHEVID